MEHGRFKARLSGSTSGNVLLRKAQHDALNNPKVTLDIVRYIVAGKLKIPAMY